MKNKILIVICLFFKVYLTHGQMKIASTTGTANESSILEVESTNRGFLPPRIFLNNNTSVLNGESPQDGMIVFNTNFSNGLGGLCIWHHARWNKLQDTRTRQPMSYVELRQTARQSLNFGDNLINWSNFTGAQNAVGDLPMWTNGSNITIRRAGIYSITAGISMQSSVDEIPRPFGQGYAFISKNGVQVAGNGYSISGRFFSLNVVAMIYCEVNDIVNIGVFNGTNIGTTTVGNSYDMKAFVMRIPPVTLE